MSKANEECKEKRSFMKKYITFAEKLSDGSGLAAAYLLIPLVVVFLIEIVARNVFNHPTTWAYGTCFILGGCAALLGFGYALKNGAMVRIDILYAKFPQKVKNILDIILHILIFMPLSGGGAYYCIINAIVSVNTLETFSVGSWNAPIWPTKIVMAISFTILTLQGIAEIFKDVERLKTLKQEAKD